MYGSEQYIIRQILKGIGVLFLVLSLCQCATKVTPNGQPQGNKQLATPYTMPADAYLALAQNRDGDEKQSLLLMAAGRLVHDGKWRQAVTVLGRTSHLSAEQADEKNLLLAKVALTRDQPKTAIKHLSDVHGITKLPLYYQAQYHEMLASAYQKLGHIPESLAERMKLEALLPDDLSRTNNRRALWLALTKLPRSELDTLSAETSAGSSLDGWFKLALISRHKYIDPQFMLDDISDWQRRYPNHPAEHLLPPLSTVRSRLFPSPRRVALLLPLTGPLRGPGNAIRDGFMDGYEANKTRQSMDIRVYDTNGANVAALYHQAISDGAAYIVGPLKKSNVSIISNMHHPVPTVLLNDVDVGVRGNAYQFGLSPTHEARQVAVKARKNGYQRALIIAPEGDWGNGVVNAFSGQWRGADGHVTDILRYSSQTNLHDAIRDFLHISDSEARQRRLKEALGHKMQATPRRRQDFDMIFLVAYPSQARQIMPLLRYYYAGNMPVYATSSVYAGSPDTIKDRDLEGIIFCDMPWVFTNQVADKNWPEQLNSYNRLYALGMDSYALSTQLNQLLLFPALGIRDKSGVLYLRGNQDIARILLFGQFKQGKAELIDET